MEWPQSLPLCLLFSALAGLSLVLSTAVLAFTKKQAEKRKLQSQGSTALPTKGWIFGYVGNIVFQLLSFGFQTIGTFVGPVSVMAPTSVAAQLLANVIIFCFMLKYELLTKDTLAGTLVITVGVILLVFVGPEFPDSGQDIVQLLSRTEATLWAACVVVVSAIVFPYHFLLGCTTSKLVTEKRSFAFLLMWEMSNSLLAASSLKALALTEGKAFLVTIAVALYSNGMLVYASMLRAMWVKRQSIYLPLGLSAYLSSSGITGAIVWNDEIQSVGSYVCIFVLFGIGGYLLSDFELMSSSNAQLKYGSFAERDFSVGHRRSNEAREEDNAMKAICELQQEMREKGFLSCDFSRAFSGDGSLVPDELNSMDLTDSEKQEESSTTLVEEADEVEV